MLSVKDEKDVSGDALDVGLWVMRSAFVELPLDVQSRHVVERVQSESLRLLCPELTDPLKRG